MCTTVIQAFASTCLGTLNLHTHFIHTHIWWYRFIILHTVISSQSHPHDTDRQTNNHVWPHPQSTTNIYHQIRELWSTHYWIKVNTQTLTSSYTKLYTQDGGNDLQIQWCTSGSHLHTAEHSCQDPEDSTFKNNTTPFTKTGISHHGKIYMDVSAKEKHTDTSKTHTYLSQTSFMTEVRGFFWNKRKLWNELSVH